MSESNKKQGLSMSTIGRLKTFTGSLIQRDKEKLVFPPPSWELNDSPGNATSSAESTNEVTPATPQPPIDPPEPVSFAKRLRSLIEALPIPSSNSFHPTSPKIPQDEPQFQTEEGTQGSPVPPELDENILRMLSSEDIMNGRSPSGSATPSKSKNQQSIWSALAGLGRDVKDRVVPTKVEEKEEAVMMYAPLQPDNNSQLELAETQSVLEYIDEPNVPQDNSSHRVGNETLVEKQVWVPSTTQLSVLTTWWGYRLYLPPPVMNILDATSLKATARAAMITSALKWVLDKLPLTLVPPQFRGAVALLKRLGPVVGYIGVFISWSWNRIRACDKGNGVVLTATWLLPVALIPMAWDAGDIYGPSLPPKGAEIKHGPEPEPEVVQEQPELKEEKKGKWRYRW
ncbi:hypothetical protein BDQ17DRAFT_1420548 [Cyathus striatus]|nr:hypothetical protein BDQ17DRAFT_1420548 [Cyathus striatus]